jgi:5-hydroxyisourate hydrolase
MPGLSLHVVDVSRGMPAAGMRVEVWRNGTGGECLAKAVVGASGAVAADALLERRLEAGTYEARFFVAEWYRKQGVALPEPAFLDVVPFRFGIADPRQHYHLPFKVTPWGFSLFRGGA